METEVVKEVVDQLISHSNDSVQSIEQDTKQACKSQAIGNTPDTNLQCSEIEVQADHPTVEQLDKNVDLKPKSSTTPKEKKENPPSCPDRAMAIQSPPRPSLPRFPLRMGITWTKGEKLEAMDRTLTWYPSKIVEIAAEEKLVLVHFEGWNQRYDEWLPMDSDKLRPTTRHSERKDKVIKKRRVHPHPIYRPGERVLAKWTDCKKYPAKVNRQLEDGIYEVTFFDGVTQNIQASHMVPFPEGEQMKKVGGVPVDKKSPQKTNSSPPVQRSSGSFKSIKLKLPDSVTKKLSKPKSKLGMQQLKHASVRLSPLKSKSATQRLTSAQMARKSKNLSIACANRTLFKNRDADPSKESTSTSSLPSTSPCLPEPPSTSLDSSTPHSSSPHSSLPNSSLPNSSLPHSSLPGSTDCETTKPTCSEGGIKVKISLTEGVAELAPGFSNLGHISRKRKKKFKNKNGLDMKKRKKHKHRLTEDPSPQKRAQVDNPRPVSLDTGLPPGLTMPLPLGYRYELFAPKKAFVVEEDHNPFKCKHDGCTKEFRKEALLSSHIRFYHSGIEDLPAPASCSPQSSCGMTSPLSTTMTTSSIVVPQPALPIQTTPHLSLSAHTRKRRKKTSSICSTDSDMSVSSKGGKSSSKRKRNDSEISVTVASPDLAVKDVWSDIRPKLEERVKLEVGPKLEDGQLDLVTVDMDEEEDEDSDMVNCVCGLRQTGGLMIQCDVCMCWQHFACVDTKGEGKPPVNYVCAVCGDTPGVRDSSKHLHDMSWERRGELPAFPFTSEKESSHITAVANHCNELIGSLQSIKSVLHSTRRQIKISKEDEDPEFQLWQTDWDNWVKPEEDLLTPHSTDHAPSPTPSTFLFPPARTATATSDTPVISSNMETASAHSVPDSSQVSTSNDLTISTSMISPSDNLINVDTLSPPQTGVQLPPQTTPQSVRRRQAISSGEAGGLVRDLFPGPGGDADMMHTDQSPQELSRPNCVSDGVPLSREVANNRYGSPLLPSQSNDRSSLLPHENHIDRDPSTNSVPRLRDSLVSENLNGVHQNGGNGITYEEMKECQSSPIGSPSIDLDIDDDDNDTDTAEESTEAYRHCEMNLLVHVGRVHGDIESQLDLLEKQIIELESSEHSHPSIQLSEDNVLNDVPALKKSLGKLSHNLNKIHRLSLYQ